MIKTPDFSEITSFVRNEARINLVSILSFNQIKYSRCRHDWEIRGNSLQAEKYTKETDI